MQTKAQINNDIDNLISFMQKNRQSLSQSIFPSYDREILTIKDHFYRIVDNLTSEFTEQELYTIETNLFFYYQALKEIIDDINDRFQIQNPPAVINPAHLTYGQDSCRQT